ncbi:MAG: tyrosine recombinase XerC [Dysgonamonadaceae bacterium]|jgi:integrase/recombinase XerC|nr:tyrosine recombinase XerC [Dysgonamonadaceae bacterium]
MYTESFLQYLKIEKNYSSHTVESYENDLKQFKEFAGDGDILDPASVNSVCVRRWIVSMMDKGYSPLSVNRKLSTLKSYCKYLRCNKIMDVNPLRLVQGPKAGKPLPHFVKDSDMKLLLDGDDTDNSFESERNKAILEVFYSTGIRCAELVGLKNGDVDFGAHTIKVTGKRNRQRLIPFSSALEEVLFSYIKKKNKETEPETDAFFIRKNGRPLSNSIVYGIVHNSLAAVPNLSKRSPHVLRHTFATSMLNNGADLNAVKELLGHQSLSSTEVYTHTSFEELKKVYNKAHPRA